MSSDNKQLILVIMPAIALAIFFVILAIVIIRKLRLRARRTSILPTVECKSTHEQQTFDQYHLTPLTEIDLNDPPFLTELPAAYQPQRPHKNRFQQFQEKMQEQRNRGPKQPVEPWHLKPKGAAYWKQVGAEMQAQKTWQEKMADRLDGMRYK